jgi:hypothetical protein
MLISPELHSPQIVDEFLFREGALTESIQILDGDESI